MLSVLVDSCKCIFSKRMQVRGGCADLFHSEILGNMVHFINMYFVLLWCSVHWRKECTGWMLNVNARVVSWVGMMATVHPSRPNMFYFFSNSSVSNSPP